MMKNATLYARTGAAAIAAVLALSSTQLAAQDAAPVPDPVTEAPVTTTAPVSTTVETPAPEAPPATTTTAQPVAAKPALVKRTSTVGKPTAPKAAATSSARPAARAKPAPVALEQTAAAKPAPIVDMTPQPAAAAARPAPASQPAAREGVSDEQAMIYGGGALALLALGGAAFAMRRRRRGADEEEPWDYEVEEPLAETSTAPVDEPHAQPLVTPAPVAEQPMELNRRAFVAPELSAFNWGNQAQSAASPATPRADPATDDGSDRKPGESWVERAYRGPSPANPSVSLRNRLRRAAFFDKREREVAAGTAAPVDPDAGLPDAMVDEQERELEQA